jgi:hypothetical protein
MPKDDKTRERLKRRNEAVVKEYNDLVRKNPKWRHDAIIEDVANKYFLSETTINLILNGYYDHLWQETEAKPEVAEINRRGKKPSLIPSQTNISFT